MHHLGVQSWMLLRHISSILVALSVSDTSFTRSLYLVFFTCVSQGRNQMPYLMSLNQRHSEVPDIPDTWSGACMSWDLTGNLLLQVEAELTPETKSRVAVQFKKFKILGLIPITAPENAKGKLDTTYLDEELRVSRGDRGNLFVLERYEDLPQ